MKKTSLSYEQLPPELWIAVLAYLNTRELHTVMLLGKPFYRLAVPLLYEVVTWKTELRGLLRRSPSSCFLVNDPNNIVANVKQCTIARGTEHYGSLVPWDLDENNNPPLQPFLSFPHMMQQFSFELAEEPIMYHPISRFPIVPEPIPDNVLGVVVSKMVNLTKLVFHDITLPDEFIVMLPHLVNLRDLTVRNCLIESLCTEKQQPIPKPPAQVTNFSQFGNKVYAIGPSVLSRLFEAVISPALVFLHTTIDSFAGIGAALDALTEQPALNQLEIIYHNKFDQNARRTIEFSEMYGSSVTHLSILDTTNEALGEFKTLLPSHPRFLPNLTSYTGPSVLIEPISQGRPLSGIKVLDRVNRPRLPLSDDVAQILIQQAQQQQLAGHPFLSPQPWLEEGPDREEKIDQEVTRYLSKVLQRTIQMLCSNGAHLTRLEASTVRWDVDILWMLKEKMPNLMILSIYCQKSGPDDHFYMSFWGIFLDYFPILEKLHVYDVSRPSTQGISLFDQRSAVKMISKRRPSFSEMSMTRGVVWKKLSGHHGWFYQVRDRWNGIEGDDPLVASVPQAPHSTIMPKPTINMALYQSRRSSSSGSADDGEDVGESSAATDEEQDWRGTAVINAPVLFNSTPPDPTYHFLDTPDEMTYAPSPSPVIITPDFTAIGRPEPWLQDTEENFLNEEAFSALPMAGDLSEESASDTFFTFDSHPSEESHSDSHLISESSPYDYPLLPYSLPYDQLEASRDDEMEDSPESQSVIFSHMPFFEDSDMDYSYSPL